MLGLSRFSRVNFICRLLFLALAFTAHDLSYCRTVCDQELVCEPVHTDPDTGNQQATSSNCRIEDRNCRDVYDPGERMDGVTVTGQRPPPWNLDAAIESNTAAWNQSWLQSALAQAGNPLSAIENPPGGSGTGDNKTATKQTDCPVLLAGLHKIEVQEDWSGSGEMPLRVERLYVSHPVRTGKNPALAKTPEFQFGLGWRGNFDKRIDFKAEANCRLSSNAVFSVTTGCATVAEQTEFRINGRLFKQNTANPGLWVQSPLPDENANAVFSSNQFVVTYHNGRVEKYDTYGRMLSVTNLNGISHTYQYLDSTTSRIASINHSGGQILTFNWSGSRLASINTPEGLITYQHETITETGTSNYLLTKVVFPDTTGEIGFDYDYYSGYNWKRLTKVRLNGEIYKEITHSNILLQNVETSGLVDGVQRSTLTVATTGSRVTVTNALGAATVYHYDTPARNRLVKIDRAGSTACPDASALYGHAEIPSSAGEGNFKYVKWKEDWTGNRTTYSYYDIEKEILETEYANGRTIKYEWDSYRRPLKKTWWDGATSQVDCTVAVCTQVVNEQLDTPLRIERYEYHGSGGKHRLKSVIEQDGLGNERKSSYTYTFHSNGLPSKVTIDGPRTDVNDITEMEYDTRGRITKKTNALGQSITYTYTGNWEKPSRVTDANGLFTDFTYDARGRVTATTLNGSITTQFRYNRFGKVDLVTRPNGTTVTYLYDSTGRLTGTNRPAGNPALIREVQGFGYDKLGNLLQQSHGYIQLVNKTINTPGGPVVIQEAQTVNNTSSRREYDTAGNLLRELGNNGQVINYTYTPNLKVQTIKDALNRTTRMDYTGEGLLQRVTRPDNTQVNFTYDRLSRLTDVTDPRNKVTQYRFDQGFAQSRINSPDTLVAYTNYNSAGLVDNIQRGDGITISYQYDALNRLISVQSNSATPQSASYVYDTCAYGKGRLCSVTDNSGSTQYSYMATGKVASKTQVIGGTAYVTSLTYGVHDRLSEISTNNGGARLRYGYDVNGEVNKVEAYLNGAWQLVVEHKAEAQKRTLVYSNILHHVRDFDLDGRLTKITASGNFIKSYSYDAANRITRINGGSAGDYYYQYDSNDRLTKELYANNAADSRSVQYAYDANGNRTSRQQGGSTTAYTIAASSNRLLSAGSTSYAYTTTGNLVSVNSGQRSFGYDDLNRLRTYNHTDGSQGTYTYNFANQRVSKTAKVGSGANETIRYLYNDNGQLLSETSPNSNAIGTSYIWFQGEIVGFIRGGTLYQVLNDHLGRPEAIYRYDSSTRILVWQAKNLAFTREIATNTLGEFNIGFPGQYYDRESGLWYNWHRYYDASIGRYIQSDPIGLAGGLNSYAYVSNNPLQRIDRFGLTGSTVNLSGGYTGRVDHFNVGGSSSFEIHVYDPRGHEIGTYGPEGWVNKHGKGVPSSVPPDLENTLKGISVDELRKRGIVPPKGAADITGNKWKDYVRTAKKACKVLGPVSVITSVAIDLSTGDSFNLGEMACDAMWGCSELQ
jgi:RHS repeat-associated protein